MKDRYLDSKGGGYFPLFHEFWIRQWELGASLGVKQYVHLCMKLLLSESMP